MKKVFLFLTMLLFAFTGTMKAELLTVHDGTGTSSYVPAYGFYADAYLKCEMVYPAAELSDMANGTINSITFYASSPAAEAWTGTWQVFVNEVADATISAFAGPGTIVYEGALDGTQSEMTITFDAPYAYNGGNLLIGVYETETGNYKSVTWAGETVEGASVQGYSYSNLESVSPTQRNFLPKATFDYTAGGGGQPAELIVHDGTGTSSYVPAYGFYADAYLKCEMVYPAAELSDMANGTINSITFYASSPAAEAWTGTWQVFVNEVADATISAFAGPGTIVYEGALDGTQSEMTITFDAPYAYNGGNLLIGVYETETGNYKSVTWAGETVEGASVQGYSYSNLESVSPTQRNFLPKTQFDYVTGGGPTPPVDPAFVTNPETLNLGARPNNAWMAPYTFELSHVGGEVNVYGFDVQNEYYSVNAEVPFVLGNEPVVVEMETGNAEAGEQLGSVVVLYNDNRNAEIIGVTGVAYDPEANDVWETAELVSLPYTGTAPDYIYHNYELPDGSEDAADAVYKVTFDAPVLFTANTTGTDGTAAVYTEDFYGVGGPAADNYYYYDGPEVGPGPMNMWFNYDYTGSNTFFGTSAGGGMIWGYKIPAATLQELGLGNCAITTVESAAREGSYYDLIILKGGDTPDISNMVYYQPFDAYEPFYYFDINLDEPQFLGDDENIWVMLYSDSPYAAYCGYYPVDTNNGKIWYTTNLSSWYSNTTYTPELYTRFLELPTGREVTVNLADMSIDKNFTASAAEVSAIEGTVMGTQKAKVAKANLGNRMEADDLYMPAGTYYVAFSSTDTEFDVNMSATPAPAPEQAIVWYPADGETGVDNIYLAQWTLGYYTEEMQVLFGSVYPPTTELIPWTSDLVESMFLPTLDHNKTYFIQVNERNYAGETEGEIVGFTTVIDGVEGFEVATDELYPGDAAVFTWTANRSIKGYNLYKNGNLVNEGGLITGTTYSVEGLTYNMPYGDDFHITAVYDEGESAPSDLITVYMTGTGFINGHVWEIDSITPVYNVVVNVVGSDEYGHEQILPVGVTNPSGYYEGEILVGEWFAVGSKDGYQDSSIEQPVELAYEQTINDVEIYMLEDWAPLGMIIATEEENDVLVEWSWDPATMIVDFETGDFSQAEFNNSVSSYPWAITTVNPHEGTYCMKSTCEGIASATSAIEATVEVPYDGKMGFWVKVSSEANYDKFHFYIDGVEQGAALSGAGNYVQKEFAITEGTHTYKWEYTKDSSVNSNDDCVYVDDITMYRQDTPVPGGQTYDFEDSTLQGWTTIDGGSPTGYGWQLVSDKIGTGYGHDASIDAVMSQSYDNNYGVVYPDNYLVSPSKINAHSGAAIHFYACAQDASYAAEHFGVAVSTGSSNNAADFTTIQEWTMTAKNAQGNTADDANPAVRGTRAQGNWYEYTVDLSSYNGQQIWVAIRHFNCSDQFYLLVDDITLSDGTAKRAEGNRTLSSFKLYRRNVNGYEAPYEDFPEEEIVLLASPGLDVFSYIDNQWPNLDYGMYQWGIQAYYEGNHHYAEKGREVLTYDFEDGLQGWTSIDADGDGYGWLRASDVMTAQPGHNGSEDFVISQSYYSGTVLYPNNYLVSPVKAQYSQISFWACGQDASYAAEHFGVAVSTGAGTTGSEFTTVQEWTMTAKSGAKGPRGMNTQGNWYQYTVDLSAYAGQDIWVALRHFNCSDEFYLDVDDVELTIAGGGGSQGGGSGTLVIDFETGDFSQYDFDNTSSYPWTVVSDNGSYVMKSGNGGVASSTSAISATVDYVVDGTVSFDALCMGEGSSTIWDKCQFFIDGTEKFCYGANQPGWNNYSYEVAQGTHLFTWSYTKDSSVNPSGDYMEVDNITFDGVAGGGGTTGGDGYSDILWSNIIEKDMYSDVTFHVSLDNGQSAEGAEIEMTEDLTGIADENGEYTFEHIVKGEYTYSVTLPGYGQVVVTDTIVENTLDIYVELKEHVDPVEDLYVSATGFAMWNGTTNIEPNGGGTTTGGGTGGGTGTASTFTEGFENGMPEGWTVIDGNNDGWTWCLTSAIPTTWTYYASLTLDWYRTGTNAICSGSYINGVGALTPNEYLVTPQLTLVNGSTFSFWAAATDASYPADHFGVFVSDNGTSDWTMVNEWTLTAKKEAVNGGRESRDGNGAKLGTWYQYTVDLSDFAGDKYLSIRHFNCNDQYIMCVDDIELTAPAKGNREALSYIVKIDGVVEGNTTEMFFQHDVEGFEDGSEHVTEVRPVYVGGNGDWSSYTWTYRDCSNFEGVTDYNVEATVVALPVNHPEVHLSWTLPEGGGGTASTFTEGFENGMPEGWTVIDGNNDGWTWCLTSAIPTTWTYYASLTLDWYRTGTNAICSGSYINGVGALTPNEYLVTPQLTLVNGSTFSFWAAATDASYPADHFGVFVSDNGTSDWTMVNEWTLTAKKEAVNGGRESRDGNGAKLGTWYQYTVDLSDFAGDKYLSIRHFNCNDQYIMCVDDLELTAGAKRDNRDMWDLVYAFEGTSGYQYGVASDGENIYTSSWSASSTSMFYKYDMEGNFIEEFNISGCGQLRGMTYDGQYFYGVANSSTVYCVDLANHTLVSTFTTSYGAMRCITFDPVRNGFWVVGNWSGNLTLIDFTGAIVQAGPAPTSASDVAYYEDPDGVEHVYCFNNGDNGVYDYNIATNTIAPTAVFNFNTNPVVTGSAGGCFVGAYGDKTCFFGDIQQSPQYIAIYELDEEGPTPPPTPTGDVLGVMIYRNGEYLDFVESPTHTYVDEDVDWETTYEYCVRVVYDGDEENPGNLYAMSCPQCETVTTGEDGVEENSVVNAIYPNPTNGELHINATAMTRISVYNAMGQMVLDQEVSGDEMILNMGQFESGVYMVQVTTESGSSVKRINVVK